MSATVEPAEGEELLHYRDPAMVAPWALCGLPMPPQPPPGARPCRECWEAAEAMLKAES